MSEIKQDLPEDGIPLRSLLVDGLVSAERLVEAQDPPEEPKAEEPTEEEGEVPTKEELVAEETESPVADWEKYLQPIQLDIENNLQVKVRLDAKEAEVDSPADDPDLGFRLVGVVHFVEEPPEDIKATLKGRPLKYEAFITPEGELADKTKLMFDTADRYEMPDEPVYYESQNVFSI